MAIQKKALDCHARTAYGLAMTGGKNSFIAVLSVVEFSKDDKLLDLGCARKIVNCCLDFWL